jgi:3-deoxy-7-phosphoheptulonate synthase
MDHKSCRLTLITRLGVGRMRQALPSLIDKVAASGAAVLWCATLCTATRSRRPAVTRRDTSTTCVGFFKVQRVLGAHSGDIHIELTCDDLTE